MWCTRWYLPLLILPFPKASPYFLVLYLVSVTLHVKPCLYCIILLIALFGSSCYWEPASTAFLLSRNPQLLNASDPYVQKRDITVEPLVELVGNYTNWNQASSNATLPIPDGTTPTPSARPSFPLTQLYERCWCDYVTSLLLADILNPTFTKRKDKKASGAPVLFPPSGFFDPFDQKGWESASLVRHSRKISPPPPPAPTPTTEEEAAATSPAEDLPETEKPKADQMPGSAWREKVRWRNLFNPVNKRWHSFVRGGDATQTPIEQPLATEGLEGNQADRMVAATSGLPDSASLERVAKDSTPPSATFHPPIPFWHFWARLWAQTVSFFRGTYDLSPYGVPVVVDFGWRRS